MFVCACKAAQIITATRHNPDWESGKLIPKNRKISFGNSLSKNSPRQFRPGHFFPKNSPTHQHSIIVHGLLVSVTAPEATSRERTKNCSKKVAAHAKTSPTLCE